MDAPITDHQPVLTSDLLGKTIDVVDVDTVPGVVWLGFADGTHLALHGEAIGNGDAIVVKCMECASEFVRD